jgi:hypothetical protein
VSITGRNSRRGPSCGPCGRRSTRRASSRSIDTRGPVWNDQRPPPSHHPSHERGSIRCCHAERKHRRSPERSPPTTLSRGPEPTALTSEQEVEAERQIAQGDAALEARGIGRPHRKPEQGEAPSFRNVSLCAATTPALRDTRQCGRGTRSAPRGRHEWHGPHDSSGALGDGNRHGEAAGGSAWHRVWTVVCTARRAPTSAVSSSFLSALHRQRAGGRALRGRDYERLSATASCVNAS